ncbi:hypothetical protein J0J70_01650 [Turicibacter bilis]|uniref:Uncharacterized protein n=1 Tax=Turicibacter bilis TaxID=2735723 RepID=A0A9Q9FGW6_9FIRM|nr:hypothetical protein [Turicibacter bilis]MBS3198167.1 hypothetical protein [Turicibacter bilis]UUF08755.1 hypothetical protein J0J70_01650 [Turicibacter bilis]
MYFQWTYPEAKIMICSIEIQRINKESWFKSSAGIKHVMGELMRCGTLIYRCNSWLLSTNKR